MTGALRAEGVTEEAGSLPILVTAELDERDAVAV
jgi:hypothetical protein